MKTLALVLILVALAGAGFSYHLTLDARFAALEQKLDQNSVALQQYQISQETAASSKTEALDHLSKEVDALQTSLKPLGNATKEQTDALTDIRKQVALLQQAQQGQQDAQKKLSDYAGQLEKIKHDIQVQAAQTPAITPASAPAPVTPVTASVPHVSSATVPMPVPPHADSAVDLRPAQSVMTDDDASVRVLPVALPVALSDLNGR
jgi:predicted phage tail protein